MAKLMSKISFRALATSIASLALLAGIAACSSGTGPQSTFAPATGVPAAGDMQTAAVTQSSAITAGPTGSATPAKLFYSLGGESGTVSSVMSSSTTASRTTATVTIPRFPYNDSWGWIAAQSYGSTSWPAATYTVSLNITRANPCVRITGVKIYRVDQYGGPGTSGLAVVGKSTGLTVSLGTTGVKTFAIAGSAQTANTTDKLAVKFYTQSTNGSSQTFGFDAGYGALSSVTTESSTAATPAPTAAPTIVPTAPSTTSSTIKHITVVLMENYAYSQVIGNSAAPFINSFANSNALFTNSHAITHPSQPNYLALFSGSTQGITSDVCPVTFDGSNLASQLEARGLTFAGYAEDMPSTYSACEAYPSTSVGSGYLYWRKHVPWADFTNVPSGDFHTYTGALSSIPAQVTFITPNICNDMHDCGVSAGDAWASKNLPAIESYDNANNGLLILTSDEGEYSSTNQIMTILAGPMVKPGQYSENINHYSVLQLIEGNFGLPLLGGAASAPSITDVIY